MEEGGDEDADRVRGGVVEAEEKEQLRDEERARQREQVLRGLRAQLLQPAEDDDVDGQGRQADPAHDLEEGQEDGVALAAVTSGVGELEERPAIPTIRRANLQEKRDNSRKSRFSDLGCG